MLKYTVYNYWRDANNQQEKNTPVFSEIIHFSFQFFIYSEHIYCENITKFYFLQMI